MMPSSCRAQTVRVLPLFATVALLAGCRRAAPPVRETWMTMGTFATITLAGDDAPRMPETAAAARECMSALEDKLSMFKEESDIARLNRSAGQAPVKVSPAVAECLRLARHYADISGGAFDITVGPLVRAWGIHGGNAPEKPLDEARIQTVLSTIGIRHLSISNGWARLDQAASVDLGGLAKGYAVDICFDRLRAMGRENFMVDLGGNLRCSGHPRRGEPWKIGVRNPFERETILGTLALTGGAAVATSGNYERFVVIQGQRYAHIVDPRTGYPVRGMAGVTVVCTNATDADALSTSLFVLGLEGSKTALARVPSCQALFVPDREPMEIWITPGFARQFTPAPEYADNVRVLE